MRSLSTVDIIDKRRIRLRNLAAELAAVNRQIEEVTARNAVRLQISKEVGRNSLSVIQAQNQAADQELSVLMKRKAELEQSMTPHGLKASHRIRYIAGSILRTIKSTIRLRRNVVRPTESPIQEVPATNPVPPLIEDILSSEPGEQSSSASI